jgi:hypothetical protein
MNGRVLEGHGDEVGAQARDDEGGPYGYVKDIDLRNDSSVL